MSSQDCNRNINFSSSQDFFQKLTPASSDRGVPHTPISGSIAMQNDLSSSWSSQSYSQQTPSSYSKSFIGKQNNSKDSLFLNEIRFSLHAVLSVVRELPDKLRLLITNSFKTKYGNDVAVSENERKLLEEKLAQLENILSLSEKLFENSLETKKDQENLLLGLNDVQKYVVSNQMEFTNLKDNFAAKNGLLAKHLLVTKKSCLGKMAEIKSLLDSLKSSVTRLRFDDLEIKIQRLVDGIKNVNLMQNAVEKLIEVLIIQGKENANKLDELFKEVAEMKGALKNLPCNFSSILKRELADVYENTSYIKQNIRLPEPVSVTGSNKYFTVTKKFPKHSPVARITPRIQGVPLNHGEGAYISVMREKFGTNVCRNSDSKFPTTLKLIEFEKSDSQGFPDVNFNRPLKRKLDWCSAYATPDQDCLKVFRRQ